MNNYDKLVHQLPDLTAKEISLLESALRGIQVLPEQYATLNSLAEEVGELRQAKDVIDSMVSKFAKPAKKRKPRSDKGITKTEDTPLKNADGEKVPVVKADQPAKEKKAAKPKTKVKGDSGSDNGTTEKPKKETADEIKANIEESGSGADKVFGEQTNEEGIDL